MSTKPKTLSLPRKPEPAEPKERSRSKSGPGNRAAPRPRSSLQSALKAKAARDTEAIQPPATAAPAVEGKTERPPRKPFTERSAGAAGARTRQTGDAKPFESRRRPRTDDSGKPAGARKPFEKSSGLFADKPFDKSRRFKRDDSADSRSTPPAGRGSFDKPRRFQRDEASNAKTPLATERKFTPRTTDRGKRPAPGGEARPWKPAAERPAVRRTAEAAPEAAPFKRAAPTPRKVPDDGKVRVSKLLSERGLCSRREADEFIERGWVFVDGQKITELGTRVSPDQEVTLDRHAKAAQLRSVTFLLNKPVGYVSGQPEPGKKPAMSLLLPENRWDEDPWGQRFEPHHLRGLAPAGRLDIDSTGLIVFTQDGRVARRLIGEDSNVEKEYLVRVEGEIVERGLKLLNHGLSLDGEKLKPAKVSWQNEDQLRFVLREGKKRQIRRMCELVGLKVVGLKRIRIGSVVLGKLPAGKWRYLRDDEKF